MKKNNAKKFFLTLLLSPLLGLHAQPTIQTSVNPDMIFTCCYKSISMINCDMVEVNNGNKLWAVTYSGLDNFGSPIAELSVWHNNSPIRTINIGSLYGNVKNPDVVITHVQNSNGAWGVTYLVCVVFESGNHIYYETYAVDLSGTPSLSSDYTTSVQVDSNGTCTLPHIDAFADKNTIVNNGPVLHDVAIAWSQLAKNGYQQIMCTITDDLVNMNAITAISVDSALHSDIAAVTYTSADDKSPQRSVFAIITQTHAAGNTQIKIAQADYDFSSGMALSVKSRTLDSTHHSAFQPRIEAQNLYNDTTGSIPWQAAAQVSDPSTPQDFYIALYNSSGGNDICRINPSEDHGSVAIAGRGAQGYVGESTPALGRDYFSVGYYTTYTHNSMGNDGDFFINPVEINGRNAGKMNGYYYEISSKDMYAPVAVEPTTDTRLAMATCSNTGAGLLSVWVPFGSHPTTGWNLRYKFSPVDVYSSKTTGIEIQAQPVYTLYPNPATSGLYINGAIAATYNITNLLGQVVATGNVQYAGYNDASIDIENLQVGVYILTLTENGFIQKMKFIKQ